MPDSENPEETKSFDLLFKGTEIATGSQRIHDVVWIDGMEVLTIEVRMRFVAYYGMNKTYKYFYSYYYKIIKITKNISIIYRLHHQILL